MPRVQATVVETIYDLKWEDKRYKINNAWNIINPLQIKKY